LKINVFKNVLLMCQIKCFSWNVQGTVLPGPLFTESNLVGCTSAQSPQTAQYVSLHRLHETVLSARYSVENKITR